MIPPVGSVVPPTPTRLVVGSAVRPYRRAVVAFMRWQQARGVLNPLDDDIRGSRWWRAVNEDLRASRSVRSVVRHGRTVITGVRE